MTSASPTLAADLARDRLLHRAARLDRVITALHVRARAYGSTAVPSPLSLSLTEFEVERRAVEARLAALLHREVSTAERA